MKFMVTSFLVGSGIWDPRWKKIRIRDKHPASATLVPTCRWTGDETTNVNKMLIVMGEHI
jgi:hypothetical protein